MAITLEPDILSQLFRGNYQWLVKRLSYTLKCRHNAEDIASETFLRLSINYNLVELREPRAMLTTISNHLVYEVWRRRDLEQAYMTALASRPEIVHPSPEEQQQIMESLILIDKALSGLSDKARDAFFCSQLDGMTYTQIAERLQVSVSMVRKYMAKALTQCYLVIAEHTPK
ncbi:RNA polymerase sigma factor [Pectobacterium araliae]|uniref:Sigma-70 family RNA polymerase sigma factor n=1 Tax=Pectobacterium araliae TaxID=3073862 RepID=A0AAN0KAX8_9GAMM|nr:sigma-70 family RNA polymerase sigma factor [Pectobacterium sp. MAFF 302110]GKW20236.1 RNA polymerase sigma factor [Pectobacterium carotovorum subsp. carotovorum]